MLLAPSATSARAFFTFLLSGLFQPSPFFTIDSSHYFLLSKSPQQQYQQQHRTIKDPRHDAKSICGIRPLLSTSSRGTRCPRGYRDGQRRNWQRRRRRTAPGQSGSPKGLLPKSGATQEDPHLHRHLAADGYYPSCRHYEGHFEGAMASA